jgi:uncharacterized protein (TIGR02118 family)
VHKLIVLFRRPPDSELFETRWSLEFVPLAERMPGLRRVAVSRGYGSPAGQSTTYLVHEFFFDDGRALRSAMTSEAGQQAGAKLMAIAAGAVELCFAEHLEEARPQEGQADKS